MVQKWIDHGAKRIVKQARMGSPEDHRDGSVSTHRAHIVTEATDYSHNYK